ncbi:MAG: fur [Planctomycetaceae bacterium]|nr:fur [Planctomycetaceae bacterium]
MPRRLTRERGLIVDEVFANHEPFEIELLVERLSQPKDGHRVSRSTIYRVMSELVKAGIVQGPRSGDGEFYDHGE